MEREERIETHLLTFSQSNTIISKLLKNKSILFPKILVYQHYCKLLINGWHVEQHNHKHSTFAMEIELISQMAIILREISKIAII